MWRPTVGTSWQWQLNSADIDLGVEAQLFDVDGMEVTAETVAELHRRGRRVVCYIDAGGWEQSRPDAGDFPRSVLGNRMADWPDERWLDIRQVDVLRPIMAKRFDLCRDKGFDAVEADLVETYREQNTGFSITREQQIAYNRMLVELAHERDMAIALKNAPDLVADMVDEYDFAVVEECFMFDECDAYKPFIDQGKAVLHVEYDVAVEAFCPTTTALGFSSMRKRVGLDAWREVCPRAAK